MISLALHARPVFDSAGLRYPDRMAGIAFPAVSQIVSLCDFLRQLPEGTTELMCHPGYPAPGGNTFSNTAREQELQALVSPQVRGAIAAGGITLIPYSVLI